MNVQDPHLHLVDPSHPTKETNFGCLYWQSLSFLGGSLAAVQHQTQAQELLNRSSFCLGFLFIEPA